MSARTSIIERPDPDQLQQWVIVDGVAPGLIGALLGMSRATGYAWLHRYGITTDSPVIRQASLAQRWRSGISAAELAADTNLSVDAVRERLIAAQLLPAHRSYFAVGSPTDPSPEFLLRELYVRQGFTVSQIAVVTGLTDRQIRYRLARYRLSRRTPGPQGRAHLVLSETVLSELYLGEELTCAQIAVRSGFSTETIRKLLTRYDIARRSAGKPRHLNRHSQAPCEETPDTTTPTVGLGLRHRSPSNPG